MAKSASSGSRVVAQTRHSVTALAGGDRIVSLRFKDREMFGHFAGQLVGHQVPHKLAGFQTLELTSASLTTMPQHLGLRLRDLLSSNGVQVFLSPTSGKRTVNSPEKTKQILKKLTQEL